MRRFALLPLALLPFILLIPVETLAGGRSAAAAIPKPLITQGATWLFDVTARQPDGATDTWTERWTVNSVEVIDGAKRVYIDVEKPDGGGELPETTIEIIIKGAALWDVYTLDRMRPPATRDVSRIVAQRQPLVDFARATRAAVFARLPGDPARFTRYLLATEATVRPGVVLANVYEATHARGETDSTETWWFDAKKGLVAMRSQFPVVGGGTVFTWVAR